MAKKNNNNEFKSKVTKESHFNFKGKHYTFEEFKEAHEITSDEQALQVLQVLEKKGSVKVIEAQKNAQQKAFEKAAKEDMISKLADAIDAEDENAKDNKAESKREGRLTYESIEVDYPNHYKAVEAKEHFEEKLRIEVDLITRGSKTILGFHNITDAELNYINRVYMADKAINATVGTVNKGVEAITGSLDYTARKVIAPTLQIGAKAGASLLKSLAHTAAKTGATFISAGSQGFKETKNAIMQDPDIIKAGRDLIDVKDGIVRGVSGKGGSTSSGIRIIK